MITRTHSLFILLHFIAPLLAFSSMEKQSIEPTQEIHLSTQEIINLELEQRENCRKDLPFSPLFCYFHPPKGWEIVEPNPLSPQVKMAFIKKPKKEGFCPSLNLAIEEAEGTLNEYLNAVKLIYEQNRKNHWRKLGKVRTSSGEAQLTELDTISTFGPVRILQLILLKERRAYIVTAAALKKDFCSFYRDFQETFHSLTITDDLFENIPQLARRITIKQEQENLFKVWKEMQIKAEEKIQPFSHENFQQNYWIPFQKKIMDNFEDMGSFWQVLVLLRARQILEI